MRKTRKFNCFYGKVEKRKGFTLIEILVALAILTIIIGSMIRLLSSSYVSMQDSEMRNIAKNIANYTVEYIRSRNVTYSLQGGDNRLGHDPSEFGNDSAHNLPGLVDIQDNMLVSPPVNSPLKSNGDSSGSGSVCINTHPALPDKTYGSNPNAFYFSLQGCVSLSNPPSGSSEDVNLYIDNGVYHNIDVSAENGGVHTVNNLVICFPFDATDLEAIKDFSASSDYYPMVYSTEPDKTAPGDPEYNPFYTKDASLKNKTMAYRGFRVLTEIVARKKNALDPDHVQYYDVNVTVFWMAGGKNEHSYSVATQIVTYGGS